MQTKKLRGKQLGRIIVILIILAIAQSIPALFSSINQMNIIQGFVNGIKPDDSVINASDNLQQVFGILSLIIYIPFFILFLIWFRKAYQNLELFNIDTKFGSGWAIGGFFVPILGFVRPFQICKEIVDGSNKRENNYSKVILIVIWWLFFWISSITGNILLRTIPGENSDLQKFVTFTQVTVFSDAIDILLYPLFLILIITIIKMQNTKYKELISTKTTVNINPEI